MNNDEHTHTHTYTIYMAHIYSGENGVIYIAMVSVASSPVHPPESPPKAVDLSTKSINSISFLSSRSRKCPCPRHHHTERHSPDVQLRLENHARTEFLFQAVELAAIDVLLRPSVQINPMCASCLFYIYLFSLSLSLRVCALVCPACLPVYSSARALSMHVLVHSLSLTLINSIHPPPPSQSGWFCFTRVGRADFNRSRVGERGKDPFSLNVARDRNPATYATTRVF